MLNLRTINRIRRNLPQLVFDHRLDRGERSDEERDYLAHYGLDSLPGIHGAIHRMGCFSSHGFQVACHYWLPVEPRGTVFVLHGYFDHAGLYGNLFRYLLEKNYAVVAFDLPGHGLSSGERISIDSFNRYVRIFADLLDRSSQRLPQPWIGAGQSTGGAILLNYLLDSSLHQQQDMLERAVLLAPLVRPVQWWARKMIYFANRAFRRGLKRRFYPSSRNETFNDFVRLYDPLQDMRIPIPWMGAMKQWGESFKERPQRDFPLTVVQGDNDRTVDWRYNLRAIREKFPQAKIELIRGGRHQLVNEIPILREKIFTAMEL